MRWRRHRSRPILTSECGRYEIAGRYDGGYFAWRGRATDNDHLVCSSADREFVKLTCATHAAKIEAEAAT